MNTQTTHGFSLPAFNRITKTLVLLSLFLSFGLGTAWADVSTLTFSAACGGSGTADDGAAWTVTSDAAESNYDNTKGIHYGTGKKAVSYLNISTSDISGTITQIVVNASGASGTSAKLNVTVGGSAFDSQQSLSSSASNFTLTGSASGEIVIAITQTSATIALYCKSITVTYSSGGGTPTLSSISVSTAPTKTTYTEGETFDPTGLVITRNYSSGDPDTYAYAGHTSDFSFSPDLSTALTTSDTEVTITYGGKSTTQAITVNASGGGGSAGTGTINFGSADGSTKINSTSVTGDDNLGNEWTITTVGTTSFTPQPSYCQVGSSNNPATSITFEMDLSEAMNITAFSAKFGGFNSTAGDITLEIDGDEVGSGSLNGTTDVTASALAANLPVTGSTLTVTVTNIAKGVKCYYISYTCEEASTDPTIKATPTSLTGFTANYGGGASESKTISVSGKNLTGNLTVSIPSNADFQISSNGSTWGNSLTLTQSAGTVAATTIYVRMKAGLGVGDHSGTITISGGGATSKEVALSGSVVVECSTPTLEFDGNPTNIDKQVGDTKFTIAATATGNTLGAAITYSSDKTSKASVDPNTGEVTIKEATGSGAPVTITATLAYKSTSTACQNEVTATYTITIYNKVTWLVNGISHTTGNPTQQTLQGGTIDAYPSDPDGSSVCGGKTFMGWTTEDYKDYSADTKPTVLYRSLSDMSSIHITANTTYYAVFAEAGGKSSTEFVKGTSSDLTTGEKVVIVLHNGSKAIDSVASGIGYAAVGLSISNEKFTTNDESIIWDVTQGTSGYYFYQGSNYLNAAETSGGKHYLYVDQYTDEWTLTAGTVSTSSYVLNSSEDPGYKIDLYTGIFSTYTGSGNAYEFDFYVPAVSYSDYSTTCGPTIKVGAVEYLTSTSGQTVKSQAITVKGSSLSGSTLTANIGGTNSGYFGYTITEPTITAGAIETTFIISYTPTFYGQTHEASITFSDGTTTSDPITLHGRSLPEQFAIVAYDETNYYVLDGSMSGTASLVEPLRVEVSGGSVVACPSRAVYSLTELDTPDQNVYLVGPAGRLWGSKTGSDLNTKSLTSTSQTAWLLTTSDGITYHITNAEPTANRGVMYNSSSYYFGHYATSNYGKSGYYGDLQFLPITATCTCLNSPKPTVVARSQTATLTWSEIPDAVNYVVTCTGGTVTVTGTTATITGLAQSTEYTYTIKSVAESNDCSTTRQGSFTTTDCDDVPSGISITAGTKTATIKWNASVSTATIRIYSAPEATDGDEITELRQTNVGSPCTISGLEENTTYYAKIFAGGSCVSTVQSFTTQSTAVEIAEWKTDGINIYLNADELTASVLIEDKITNVTTTENEATGLFFSKYYEAYQNVKLWAIFNGTKDTISLTNMKVKVASNGGGWGAVGAQGVTSLSSFGHVKTGYICPGEEIIVYCPGNTAADGNIMSCMEEKYGTAYKDNPDSLWYLVNNNTTAISGDDGLILLNGTDTLDVIGGLHTANAFSHTSKRSWGDAKGWFCTDGENEEGETLEISTNRCLLVRKNTVKDGLNAVEKNKDDFVTLCDEWWGAHVTGGDEVQSSCDNFSYVGHYDYNAYYAKYDSLTMADELWGNRNEDGTYRIDIPYLDTLSCNMLRLKVYEGDELKVQREYKVPIMVSDAKMTTSEIFRNYGKTADVCKTCDVVILEGATLTKDADGSTDVPEVRDIKIYPRGKLVVPSGRTYSVSSLSFRREEDSIARADIRGDLTITSAGGQNIYFDLRIDPSDWHYVALPYDCNISEVTFSNGDPAVQNVDFFVKWYDGEERAANLKGGWKHVTNGVMRKGQGYIVGLAGSGTTKRELRFPLSDHILTEEKASGGKTIDGFYAFGGDKTTEQLRPNHKGWNLIGNPYLGDYAVNFGEKLRTGKLIPDESEPNLWTIETGTDGIQYIVAPVANGRAEYKQMTLSEENMRPFTAYFVQIGGTDPSVEQSIIYTQSGRRSIVSRHYSATEEDNHPVWFGVTLTNNLGEQDKTTLLISNQFTNGYDMMDDLVKMRGTKYSSYSKPVLASRNDEGEMAFNALPDSTARLGIPLNFFAAAEGQYKIALDGRYSLEEVTSAQLYDSQLQTWHNLLTEDYSFTSARTDNTTRFKLYVTVERKQPQTPTEIDNIYGKLTLTANDRTLLLSGLHADADIYVYDVSGKLIDSGSHFADSDNGVWRTTVPTQGVYFVRVNIGTEQQTLNTIVY